MKEQVEKLFNDGLTVSQISLKLHLTYVEVKEYLGLSIPAYSKLSNRELPEFKDNLEQFKKGFPALCELNAEEEGKAWSILIDFL